MMMSTIAIKSMTISYFFKIRPFSLEEARIVLLWPILRDRLNFVYFSWISVEWPVAYLQEFFANAPQAAQ